MSTPTLSLPPSLSLLNKVAIVTGSSRGIGKAIALMLASRGARIAIHYTSSSSTSLAQAIVNSINNDASLPQTQPRACLVRADLLDLSCGKDVVQGALRGLGVEKIDLLVNNASAGPAPKMATEDDIEGLEMSVALNMRAPMLLVREFVPVMVEKGGRIVNVSSVITRFPVTGRTSYAITKAALETLTVQHAVELAKPYHCTVNAVRVGTTVTEDSQSEEASNDEARMAARAKVIERTSAAERMGEVGDVAEVVAWLCCEGSRWVNGQVVNANGGVVFT